MSLEGGMRMTNIRERVITKKTYLFDLGEQVIDCRTITPPILRNKKETYSNYNLNKTSIMLDALVFQEPLKTISKTTRKELLADRLKYIKVDFR